MVTSIAGDAPGKFYERPLPWQKKFLNAREIVLSGG
jgi:hypothetical protein